jgi:hypothetical protein
MTEAEEPQFTSLSARIAALNQSQVGRNLNNGPNGPPSVGKRAPPPPPPRPATEFQRSQLDFRNKSANNIAISTFDTIVTKQTNNEATSAKAVETLPPPPVDRGTIKIPPELPSRKVPPPLPSRTSQEPSPPLPYRKSSDHLMVRRASNDSMISENSAASIFSMGLSVSTSASSVDTCVGPTRKLPPALGDAVLPPLPPTRRELEEKARLEKRSRTFSPSTKSAPTTPYHTKTPALPPRLPSRPKKIAQAEVEIVAPVARRLPPTIIPPIPQRPTSTLSNNAHSAGDKPPLVPYASRPTYQQIKPRKKTSVRTPSNSCLICRDFSGPDSVAARYPRLSNPDNSPDYLAEVLCGPFESPTDKARAIFTWLHYNIDYDTEAFFGNNVKHSSPEETIARGLGVCDGYAGVFLAIALKAGLECVKVTGHGKGFGYFQPRDGSPIPPPNPTGHAWNAIRIDDGEWKLIDACWGAGHVNNQQYFRKFSPSCFTANNEDFGEKHFPSNDAYFFRKDGSILTWEQYILGPNRYEPLQLYGVVEEYGISKVSFLPPQKLIVADNGGTTRFQFSKMCIHWDHLKNGGGHPYPMILQINGLDGRESDFVPFDYDGTYWWVDVADRHLGCASQKINAYAVTSINGRDARGVSKSEYLAQKGKAAMGFQTVATWDLV